MNIVELARQVSLWGGALLLFLETAVLFGLFLPGGDSLVLALGALASAGAVHPVLLWLALAAATTLGQWVGFFWGRKLGPGLERRIDPDRLRRARRFLGRFGAWAVFLAPWLPVVRTLTPFLMGAARLPVPAYLLVSALAAWIWTGSLTAVGYLAAAWVLRLLAG